MSNVLKLHPNDNVLVALADLKAGDTKTWDGVPVELVEDIPAKHKFFCNSMPIHSEIFMYGVVVGKTQRTVMAGEKMTVENTVHAAEPYKIRTTNFQWTAPDVSKFAHRTFQGFLRSDGRAGTANYWLVIPTVFCENRNLDVLKQVLYKALGYEAFDSYQHYANELKLAIERGDPLDEVVFAKGKNKPNSNRVFPQVDGIKFLNHQGGCGGTRQDAATLSSLLAAYANHPNVAGVSILSLGCEHLQTDLLLADIKKLNPAFDKPLHVYKQQLAQSEEALLQRVMLDIFKGLEKINQASRQPLPLSKLCIGVKCGGSDGFSGISANPAVGYAADLLVALGGQILLAEFPELCGAEQDLIDRTVDISTAEKFVQLMQEYDAMAHRVGSGFYMNPSPGNIKDGLITDAIKSTGAARKGGTSPVVDVLDYTEPVKKPGLSLVCTPGNDVEATTGKAASGATLILFTTGLGTPTGNAVCPTIKLSTSTALAQRMPDIIDIDCGPVITGEKTIQQMGEEILEYCIRAASGEEIPKAVALQQDDFIPWKRGVSL